MGIVKTIRTELTLWRREFLSILPGQVGEKCRNAFYGYRVGPKSRVLSHVTIYYPAQLSIGEHSAITSYCQLNAAGGITIGDDVLIGPGSVIWSQNHRFDALDIPIRRQGYDKRQITIENDVWVASRAVILAGVTLGRGTVVAAGAVVTKSTEPYSIVAGVPARVIGRRGQGAARLECEVPGSLVSALSE